MLKHTQVRRGHCENYCNTDFIVNITHIHALREYMHIIHKHIFSATRRRLEEKRTALKPSTVDVTLNKNKMVNRRGFDFFFNNSQLALKKRCCSVFYVKLTSKKGRQHFTFLY